MPIERFLEFLPNTGHSANEMKNAVIEVLKKYSINIENCRWQSYDNAANMAGTYNGFQAQILKIAPLATFIPCSAHSLNLVAKSAANISLEAKIFFSMIDGVYNFFSASTRLWDKLKFQSIVVKKLCPTRWSARADAISNLRVNLPKIVEIFENIANDENEKYDIVAAAIGYIKQLNRIETNILLAYWDTILERFEITSKKLQDIETDIITVENLYNSLIGYVGDQSKNFTVFEHEAKKICDTESYDDECKRFNRPKLFHDDSVQNNIPLTGRDRFKKNVFDPINKSIIAELQKRSKAYKNFANKFLFINQLTILNITEIQSKANVLLKTYEIDLEDCFINECVHIREYLKEIKVNNPSLSALYSIIRQRSLESVYPNLEIALRIFLSTPASNCSAERSFSALRRIKSYMRSSLSQEKLNAFTILASSNDMLENLVFEEIYNEFIKLKIRRKF